MHGEKPSKDGTPIKLVYTIINFKSYILFNQIKWLLTKPLSQQKCINFKRRGTGLSTVSRWVVLDSTRPWSAGLHDHWETIFDSLKTFILWLLLVLLRL